MDKYISPFELLLEKNSDGFRLKYDELRDYQYQGDLEHLLNNLNKTLPKILLNPNPMQYTEEELMNLILNPPLIIRSILDYKCNNPNSELDFVKLNLIGTKLISSVYSRDLTESMKGLDLIKNYLYLESNSLDSEIKKELDCVSWGASNPIYTENTVDKIKSLTNNGKFLLLNLGHGGVISGMDLFNRLQNQDLDIESYIVRFSRAKKRDKVPNLTLDEIAFLKEKAKDRTTIIYDEDIASGNTLKYAKSFFEDTIVSSSLVYTTANYKVPMM